MHFKKQKKKFAYYFFWWSHLHIFTFKIIVNLFLIYVNLKLGIQNNPLFFATKINGK